MTESKNPPLKYFIALENRARYKLIKRYNKPLSYHDVKIINDILYNEKTHYVEQFKEYLIYEDYNEFLKRFYKSFDINIKLPKILNFYEKYSKIYANYTVIPESKYMYKNIKRKQKMIDQMQNNQINNSELEEDEESNEDISNTVFSSRVINSIYGKTITTLNKSDNDGNTEQSINDFLGKINLIENKINNCLKNNYINKENKAQKELHPNKKLKKEFLINKNKTNFKYIKNVDKKNNETEIKKKIIDIQFTHSKKVLPSQNELKKNNNINNNSKININNNANNKNNFSNLIFINSYASKTKNNVNIFNNNNSVNNSINTFNNNNTFNGQKSSLKTNTSFPKHKMPTVLLKQNIINSSNNLNNYKENMSLTNINNYLTNINNINNEQKYKLSLGENLLKLDKIALITNSSSSPKIINESLFSPPNDKVNIFKNNKQKEIQNKEKEKINEKKKNKNENKASQALSSNKISNVKKIKSHLLGSNNYSSFGNNLTFLSNKYMENHKLKNIANKLSKKNSNKKNNGKNDKNNNNENILNDEQLIKIYKKPESHRNYGHSKMLSGNSSNTKNKINNIINNNSNNSNKNFKITVGIKHAPKHNSQKIISTPCSPSSSSTNFYFQSQVNSRKNSINNLDKNIKKTLNDNKKKKVVNNFNIVNNIHDNSTQINIYTGNNLYKSLHFHNNSVFNSSNITPGNILSKSPVGQGGGNIKNKKNIENVNPQSNNTTYFNSNFKVKEKQTKYNLDLKKIIHKQNIEGEKAIISARQITNRKLFEKLGKYFFKNKNDKNNFNNNYNSNKNINIKNNSKNNNIKNKNYNDYNLLINKIINKNCNSNKVLKNKTNNNTPIKNKYTPYITKNHRKVPNICLSPHINEQINQMNKGTSRQNINYNNIISNLNDLKNIGIDDGAKLLIHSERNKISKIIFK